MSSTTVHPKCDKRYPANNTVGHCSQCHQHFSGLGAFDQHQFHLNGKVLCSDPAGTNSDKWWIDELDIWHWGAKMTKEEKERAWG